MLSFGSFLHVDCSSCICLSFFPCVCVFTMPVWLCYITRPQETANVFVRWVNSGPQRQTVELCHIVQDVTLWLLLLNICLLWWQHLDRASYSGDAKNNKDGWMYFPPYLTLHPDRLKMSGGERHKRNAFWRLIGWTFLFFHCRPIRFFRCQLATAHSLLLVARGDTRCMSPLLIWTSACVCFDRASLFYTNSLRCWSLIFCQ